MEFPLEGLGLDRRGRSPEFESKCSSPSTDDDRAPKEVSSMSSTLATPRPLVADCESGVEVICMEGIRGSP
jgi:hypothetical protein